MENRFIQKIPLNPPLPKGEDAKKDSRLSSVRTQADSPRRTSPPECGQAGMTDKCGLTYELLSNYKERGSTPMGLKRRLSLSKILNLFPDLKGRGNHDYQLNIPLFFCPVPE